MGAARQALQDKPLSTQDRLVLRSALEEEVERAKGSMDRVKALIRLNEFLLEEKALMLSSSD